MAGGKCKIRPEDGKQFSTTNQPSPQAKSLGKRKKWLLREISSQLLAGDSKKAFTSLAGYLGVGPDEIDIETAMHLKQVEKALKNGDTTAYNAVMDRIKGKPVQAITMETPDIRPIKLIDATRGNGNTST